MNMYREVEEPKIKRDYTKEIKTSAETSFIGRTVALIRVTRAIKKVTADDTKKLREIQNEIDKYDLADPQFGKTLSDASLEKFNKMVEENELYSEQCAI